MIERSFLNFFPSALTPKYIQSGRNFQMVTKRCIMAAVTLNKLENRQHLELEHDRHFSESIKVQIVGKWMFYPSTALIYFDSRSIWAFRLIPIAVSASNIGNQLDGTGLKPFESSIFTTNDVERAAFHERQDINFVGIGIFQQFPPLLG